MLYSGDAVRLVERCNQLRMRYLRRSSDSWILFNLFGEHFWRCVFNIVARARRFRSFAETMLPSHKVIPRFVLEIDTQEISPYFQSVILALRQMIGEDDQP
jgi:hypothetical protein